MKKSHNESIQLRVLQLIGEIGSDFVEKFDFSDKSCKWSILVPNNKISGGNLISSHIPKRKNPVGQIFWQCANSVFKLKNQIGLYIRRIRSRGVQISAIMSTAH